MIETLNTFSDVWDSLIWRSCWQGGLVLALFWMICRSLRRIPPAVQCWLWRLAYAKLLLGLCWAGTIELPLLSPAPSEAISSTDSGNVTAQDNIDDPAATPVNTFERPTQPTTAELSLPHEQSSKSSSTPPRPVFLLLIAWIIGVAVGID